nr:addiction module protein [Candidatus Sigynarchaeota archaeon]
MASKMKDIEKQALELPVEERAQLIERLIRSLDEEEDPNAEKAWIAEARRRHEELQRGEVSGKPAEQVLKEARSRP